MCGFMFTYVVCVCVKQVHSWLCVVWCVMCGCMFTYVVCTVYMSVHSSLCSVCGVVCDMVVVVYVCVSVCLCGMVVCLCGMVVCMYTNLHKLVHVLLCNLGFSPKYWRFFHSLNE